MKRIRCNCFKQHYFDISTGIPPTNFESHDWHVRDNNNRAQPPSSLHVEDAKRALDVLQNDDPKYTKQHSYQVSNDIK
eukprot:6084931-Karenia_brevis.AAC.1